MHDASAPSPVQHHVDEFAERNVFLHLALGALSAGRRLDALLDRHARADGPRGEPRPGDEALIAFTLGLIAFHQRARALLAAAAVSAPAPERRAPPAPTRIPLR